MVKHQTGGYSKMTVLYCICQIIRGRKVSQILWIETFIVKYFHFDNTALKMAGHGPGSSLNEFL